MESKLLHAVRDDILRGLDSPSQHAAIDASLF